ncbi:MAG: glycosyltransferase 87 family protein [Bdellovibrionota bacterium]
MSELETPSLSLIVPCYDEALRLPYFFESFERFYEAYATHPLLKKSEWIFVDDGSHDTTAEVLTSWIAKRGFAWQIKVLSLGENQGKGAAVRAGDAESRAPIRGFLDVDLSTTLEEILPAIARFEVLRPELMIGSRHCIGAKLAEAQPWYRILLGRLFSYFSSLFHANAFSDTQCGFKLWTAPFSRDVVQKLEEKRWAFDLEMILRGEAAGALIVETPVTWVDREGSKVSPVRDGLRMLRETLRFRAKHGSSWIWLIASILVCVSFSIALRWSNDMSTYALAWERVRVGRWSEIYEISRSGQGGYYYSPLFALLGAPLSWLPLHALRFVYATITLMIGFTGWILLKRMLRESGLRLAGQAAPWIFLMVAMSNNIFGQFQTANISLWVLSFVFFCLYRHVHSKSVSAAFWLALAVNFKVFPVFMLLYFFWQKDWRFVIFFTAWSLALVLLPALYFGWSENIHLHVQQVEMLRVYGPQNDFGREAYQALSALLVRLARSGLFGAISEGLLMKIAQVTVVVVSGIFLLTFKPGQARRERVLSFFFLMAMMGQFSPASWINSMGYCYIPMLAVLVMLCWGPNASLRARIGDGRIVGLKVCTLVFFVGYCLTAQGIVGRTLNDILERASVPTYAIFVLCAAFWVAAFAIKRSSSEDFSGPEVRAR